MINKYVLSKANLLLQKDIIDIDEIDEDLLKVSKKEETIPEEWVLNWWVDKLYELLVWREVTPVMFDSWTDGEEEQVYR